MTLRRVTGVWVYDGSAFRRVGAGGPPGPSPQAPSPPTNLDCTPSTYSLLLTWDAPVSTPEPVDFYQVSVAGSVVANPGGTSLNLTGRTPGTGYECAVRAVGDNGLASAWTPAEVFYTNPVTPAPTGTKFGFHVTSGDGGVSPFSAAYAQSVSLLGKPRVYRVFNASAVLRTPFSASSSNSPTDTDIHYAISWKPGYTALVVNKTLDGEIDGFLNFCTSNGYHVMLADNHEPDVGGDNAAEQRAMSAYVGQKVRAHGDPNIEHWAIHGGYKADSVQLSYLPDDLSLIDGYAADPYASGVKSGAKTYTGGKNIINRYLTDFADEYLPGMPLGVGELGWDRSLGTAAEGAEWYRGAFDRCIEHPMVRWCSMWNHGGDALIGTYQPAYAATAARIKQYITASPLGF